MNQHVEKTNKLVTGGGHIVWSLKGLRVHPTLQIVHITPFFWSQGPQGGVPWFSHIRLGMQKWLPMRPFSMAMAHTSSIKTYQPMERLRTLLQVYMAYSQYTQHHPDLHINHAKFHLTAARGTGAHWAFAPRRNGPSSPAADLRDFLSQGLAPEMMRRWGDGDGWISGVSDCLVEYSWVCSIWYIYIYLSYIYL